MALGVRPTVDYAFKRLLGDPAHAALTLHFLNAVLGAENRVTAVDFLNPIVAPETSDGKFTVLDLLTRDERQRQLNVEMQTTLPAALSHRLTFYTCCLYARQLKKGDDYAELRPAISICVLSQLLFPHEGDPHLVFEMRERRGNFRFTDQLQIHTLELPKCTVSRHNLKDASPLDQWLYFLNHAESMTQRQIDRWFGDPIFGEAAEVLNVISQDPLEKALYDARLRVERDDSMRLRLVREEAEQQGIKIGEQRGITIGEQRGITIGEQRGITIGEQRGITLGEQRGLLYGQIQSFQQVLGLTVTPLDELHRMTSDECERLRADLLNQLSRRRG